MRNLLNPTDRDRLVALLRDRLARPVILDGREILALAESEDVPLCAFDSNASAAGLLLQPEIRDGMLDFADGVLDFVMAMADAPVPCRSLALGGLEVRRDDPRSFEILTPFHRFAGDLGAGTVMQWLRSSAGGLPGTALAPLRHTGNMVQFHIGRHRAGVDAEDAIDAFGLERQDDTVLLWHETAAPCLAGWLRARPVMAGRLRYEYLISGRSPLLRVTVRFTAAQAVKQLRLTTALDVLGADALSLAQAQVQGADGWHRFGPPVAPGSVELAAAPPVAQVSLGQANLPARGPTLHLRPAKPTGVKDVKAVAIQGGALHWLVLRHGPVKLAAGASFTVEEDRLFAPGLRPEAAAQAMLTPGPEGRGLEGLDMEPLTPSGAALLAVASQLLLDSAQAYRVPLGEDRRATLTAWFDRHLAGLMEGMPEVEAMALALAAVEYRMRDGAALHTSFEILAVRLLDAQGNLGGFGKAGLPAHAAAILALAIAARRLPGGAPIRPMARALRALKTLDTDIAVAGADTTEAGRHAEALGLLARALGAVLLAVEDTSLPLDTEDAAMTRTLHRQTIGLMRPLVQPHEGMLEVHASALGGGATPGSQAAVTLGLMAPEALTMRLPIPSA